MRLARRPFTVATTVVACSSASSSERSAPPASLLDDEAAEIRRRALAARGQVVFVDALEPRVRAGPAPYPPSGVRRRLLRGRPTARNRAPGRRATGLGRGSADAVGLNSGDRGQGASASPRSGLQSRDLGGVAISRQGGSSASLAARAARFFSSSSGGSGGSSGLLRGGALGLAGLRRRLGRRVGSAPPASSCRLRSRPPRRPRARRRPRPSCRAPPRRRPLQNDPRRRSRCRRAVYRVASPRRRARRACSLLCGPCIKLGSPGWL